MLKKRCDMQQTTIQARGAQRTGADLVLQDVKGKVMDMAAAANAWLDRRSDLYTRVAGFEVTNRTVCRVNGITVAMLVAVVAVETAPVAALSMMGVTWWLTRRLNASDRENEKNDMDNEERKGGMR